MSEDIIRIMPAVHPCDIKATAAGSFWHTADFTYIDDVVGDSGRVNYGLAFTIAACSCAAVAMPGYNVMRSGVAFFTGMTMMPGVPVRPSS